VVTFLHVSLPKPSVWISPITHTHHRPHPSLSPWFDHLNNLWCGVQFKKILNFSTFLLLPTSEVRISSSAPFYRTQSAQVLPLMQATKFQTIYNTTGRIVFLHILILLFWDSKPEDQRFRTALWQSFPKFSFLLIPSWMQFWFARTFPTYFKFAVLKKFFCTYVYVVIFSWIMFGRQRS